MYCHLSELLDIPRIQKITDHFYPIAGINMVVADLNNVVLVRAGCPDICSRFHRLNPATAKLCEANSQSLNEQLQESASVSCLCPNGLMVYSCPIIIEGQVLGTIRAGQFLHQAPDERFYRQQAAKYGFNEKAYLEAVHQIPIIPEPYIKPFMNLMTEFAHLVASMGLERLRELEAQQALQKAHKELEVKVLERTCELNEINRALRDEIVERKKIEEALRFSEEKFSRAFRSSPVLITITTLEEGLYIEVNDTFLKVTGYSRDEVVNHSARELNCWVNHQERNHINSCLRKNGSVHEIEACFQTKSGELRIALFSAEIINISGKPHVLSTFSDITESKNIEVALMDSQQHLHDIIDFLPDATLAVDREGKVFIWNRAMEELTGVGAEEMLNKNDCEYALPFYGCKQPMLVDLVLKPDNKIDEHFSILQHDLEVIIIETMVPCLRGKPAYLWGKATPLYDSYGNIVGAIETIRDITDRQQNKEKLKKAREEMQALSHTLMQVQEDERRHLARELHDALGQTLTAVKINLQSMAHNNPMASTQLKESIAIVDQSLHDIRQLSLSLRPSVLDDLGLEAALRTHLSALMQRSGLKISFSSNLDSRRLPVKLETACFRVVQESLTNVLRHAQAQNAQVVLKLENKELILRISDDGQGFEVELAANNAVKGR
ncbi:MAG: PocR ligand-binding domain-containing protein, partial [Syntrophomonadaceae bacterium]|nr:PocR ligand-binding domain-containing protein [Syntrophomonadaceae bacterium]